jgi:UDP-N-acetylglucosamine 1-carboxyvinyltransferase
LAEKLTGLGADIYRVTVEESKLDHSPSTERVMPEEASGNLFKKIQPSLA